MKPTGSPRYSGPSPSADQSPDECTAGTIVTCRPATATVPPAFIPMIWTPAPASRSSSQRLISCMHGQTGCVRRAMSRASACRTWPGAAPRWSWWPWVTSMRSQRSTDSTARGLVGFPNQGSKRIVLSPGVRISTQACPYHVIVVPPLIRSRTSGPIVSPSGRPRRRRDGDAPAGGSIMPPASHQRSWTYLGHDRSAGRLAQCGQPFQSGSGRSWRRGRGHGDQESPAIPDANCVVLTRARRRSGQQTVAFPARGEAPGREEHG